MDYGKYPQLEFRRKFWKLFGAQIKMTQPDSEQVLGLIKMKAWKLKEDIRLYADEAQTHELMRIAARNIIDFGATYDVFDSTTNEQLFSLRRKGLKSTFVRDHWDIYDVSGNVVGFVQETSGTLALLRRYLEMIADVAGLIFMFVPQTYTINLNSSDGTPKVAANIVHRKNPFIVKMGLDFSGTEVKADPRLGIASASLLSVIDAAKNN